jgi:hypothetical protein
MTSDAAYDPAIRVLDTKLFVPRPACGAGG